MNIVLFGRPGTGKGTHSKYLKDKYNLKVICTGDLVREQLNNNTPLGLQFKEHLAKGHLVPSEDALELVKQEILKTYKEEYNHNYSGLLFDGSPRTLQEAIALNEFLTSIGIKIDVVLGLDVDDDNVLIQRILIRGITSNRKDDTDENVIKERLIEYDRKTKPVIDFFKELEIYQTINANQTIDEVCDEIDNMLLTVTALQSVRDTTN